MNVTINIERLILEGIDIPHWERPLVQAAVETELGRLLAANGVGPDFRNGGAVQRLAGGMIQLASNPDPKTLGQQIAQAVYGGLGQ